MEELISNRQTGRTTRMLEEARQLSDEGRAVYIMAASSRHANQLRESFISLFGEGPVRGIKFEYPGSTGNFDWSTLRLTSAHPNCVVVADHYAAEQEVAELTLKIERLKSLREIVAKHAHRWDKPPSPEQAGAEEGR